MSFHDNDEGYLDDQFLQLELLQDDVTPNFVEEVVASFFRDSPRLLSTIEHALQKSPLDFDRLDRFMHQFKGSSSSIGALRLKNESSLFGEYCDECNVEGCLMSFQRVKREHAILRQKLDNYFQLLHQAGPA
ncbi:Histidine-containing phosphotransfer protein 4 [Acorus calamus]|uniref:Histidine-containing phosphotransfer protein n=1 Tax=Acorus calamus TaxID=4465 RepID=A0AAV9ENC0_ACOCL|nr:Histidine-containing phosphotransfer protein 4 [Acorus calamus]